MLRAFGDESADETKQRVFAVAAVVGPPESWGELKSEWTERTGGIPFHAADCDSDKGEYKEKSHAENKALYRDLAQILAKGTVKGYARVVNLVAYNEHFPGTPRDMTYYWSFQHVVYNVTNFSKRLSSAIDFTFDKRQESDSNAGYLYSIMSSSQEWEDVMASKVSFQSSRQHPEIQMADLFAREAMKELDRELVVPQRRRRKSLDCLLNSERFKIEIYADDYFRDMKASQSKIEEVSGMSKLEYANWLADKGSRTAPAPDNVRNRMGYLAWKQGQDNAER